MTQLKTAGPLPVPDAVFESFVHDRFLDLFLGHHRRAFSGLLLAASLVALVWFEHTGSPAALLWIGAAAALSVGCFAFSDRFVRRSAAGRASGRVGLVLAANGVLMALPVGAFGLLSGLDRAAVSIILITTATASVAITAGYRQVFMAFAAPVLVTLAGGWAMVGASDAQGGAEWGMAALVLAYLAFLIGVARQIGLIFEEASRYRCGEQRLDQELKQAREQAGEANRAMTQFLAAASHDLRQPIHSMNVLIAALTLRELDERSRTIVGLLDSVNQTLSNQLDGLLDVSKLEAGVTRAEMTVLSLDRLVSAHHAAMTGVARERGLDFQLDAGDEVCVLTDGSLLTRVLSNLTDNAFKFTRRGGTVALSVRRVGDRATLVVRDSGIGIAASEHGRVFREFYQVGNAGCDRTRGLGLGLSIVRRLCDLLQIELELESSPEVGTTVTLRMPEAAAPGALAALAPVPVSLPCGYSVLIVDDERVVRESMCLLLAELGCVTYMAAGAEQAIRIAKAHPIDALLTGYRLREGGSGLQVLRAVRAIHPRASAVLVTGDIAPDRIRDAQSAGVPLLHKPVTLHSLLAALRAPVPEVGAP